MDKDSSSAAKPIVDRRRVRYRAAEDLIKEAAKHLDDSAGDREIADLLDAALTKLATRGVREKR